jgi:hypothetical protein
MKRILIAASVALACAIVPLAAAQSPPVVPFPAASAGEVFVSAQTVTPDGAMSNYFKPGSSVVFRAYAVDGKTQKLVNSKTARYFYVTLPNQSNVKMKWTPRGTRASGRYSWTGTWNVPADYTTGVVPFRVLVRMKSKRFGSFVQIPVETSQLTITNTPQSPPGNGPAPAQAAATAKVPLALYVDSVNGTRPADAAPRPIGCTQTNVFKRGEQFVLRVWGFNLTSGAVLTMDNVSEAHFVAPGLSNVTLNWGSHGAVGNKVWFWTNFWNIPKTYPLGDTIVKVSFTTTAGKTGTFDYLITIIP